MTSTHSTPVTPPAYAPQIRLYQNWLRDQRGLSFEHYNDLWQWSVSDLDAASSQVTIESVEFAHHGLRLG